MSTLVFQPAKIQELSVVLPEGKELLLHSHHADLEDAMSDGGPYCPGGSWSGEVAVKLDIDGQITQVVVAAGTSADIDVLERAIIALEVAIEALRPYPGHSSGQCMEIGDWGRCRGDAGHDARHPGHQFPTREEFVEGLPPWTP